MFGRGRTRLQPAHVEDVAEAIARVMQRAETHSMIFECDGPRIYSYEGLLRTIAREAGLKTILIPVTFATWQEERVFSMPEMDPPRVKSIEQCGRFCGRHSSPVSAIGAHRKTSARSEVIPV